MSSHSRSKDPQPSLWKSMVNKLLGPEEAAPIKPIDDPLDMEGLDLDLLPPEEPARAAPPTTAAATREAAVSFDNEPDPGGDESSETPEVLFSDEEDAVDDDLAPMEPAVAAPSTDDGYWDALGDLSVSTPDEEREEAPRGGGRGGRGGRTGGRSGGRRESPRQERSRGESRRERGDRSGGERSRRGEEPRRAPSRPAPVSEELFADDDFGAGLVEESRAQIAAAESLDEAEDLGAETREPASEPAERGDRSRRRRRRGRRGRGREGAPAGRDEAAAPERDEGFPSTADELPADVLFDEEGAEEPARAPAPAPVSDESDEFGILPEAEERPKRRRPDAERREGGGRSRSRRSRSGERREAAPAEVESTARPGEPDVENEAAGEEGEAARENRYRNVPTWEEAISYLVQPRRRGGDSGRTGSRGRGSRGGGRR